MQEEDARRRIAILRGEEPPPLKEASPPVTSDEAHLRHQQKRPRNERKRHGEDDTDFELRLAQQSNALATPTREELSQSSNAPLFDSSGHIDLLGSTPKQPKDEKNAEFEAERKNKERELEDQYTMRFSNASGRNGLSNPWYSKDDSARAVKDTPRDAFGREDPGRKDRDERRMNASDPLAMMKRGAAKVRELKQARRNFRAEREAELEEMRREDKDRDSRERRDGRSRHREHRRRDDRRRRSRSRSRSPRSSHRRHRSSERRRSRDRTSSARRHLG